MLQLKTRGLLFFGFFLSMVVLSGQDNIQMVFPDDAVVHYAKWPEGLKPRATSVQEWRREVAKNNELVKADRYDFNERGQLVRYYHYNDIISETLEYEYDQRGRPITVRYANDNGPLYTYSYNYATDHYSISRRDDQQLAGRELFYFDEEYRLIEHKTYGRLLEDSPLELESRIVYAYASDSDEPRGEMHYDFVLTGKDKGKAMQWKRVHLYNEETGLLDKTTTYKGALVRPGNWKRSRDFTEQVAEEVFTYDDKGQLISSTLNDDIYDRINEKWTYQYQQGDLREKTWQEFDLVGNAVATTITRYHDHGGVAGFEFMKDRLGSAQYRSSFVIR